MPKWQLRCVYGPGQSMLCKQKMALSDPSLLLESAGGCCTERRAASPVPASKQWQWAYLLRMAMTFMPATMGRSDDLRKLPWSCLALRTQDGVGPVPSWQSSVEACRGRL